MGDVTRRIHVIGIGAGDPDYVTAQAIAALNDTQVFFAMDESLLFSNTVLIRPILTRIFTWILVRRLLGLCTFVQHLRPP